MATKTTTNNTTNNNTTPLTATRNDEKKVTIKLPRIKGEDDTVFVSVNERTWLIKRGESVEVPECVASVLANAERMEEEADAFFKSVVR